MKRKKKLALMIAMVLSLTGCAGTVANEALEQTMQDEETAVQEVETDRSMETDMSETAGATETETEASEFVFGEDSFMWKYQGEETGIVIRLEDCQCKYESERFRIYSKYLDYASRKQSSYRYSGELLYLQTPKQSMQLYPDEYLIDHESGTIYTLYNEGDFFASIYSYCAAASPVGEICGAGVLKPYLPEEWISEAHGLAADGIEKPWPAYSNLRVNMTGVSHEQGATILRGEASGIYKATGETYCIEWELDTAAYEEKVTPIIPRIYDEETDKAVFEACAAAFDKLEQGNGTSDADADNMKKEKIREGRRVDVNGDGLPELIQESDPNGYGLSPILRIFAYVDGAEQPVEEVYSDLNDFTEYLFLGTDGTLIYDYSDHGYVGYGGYSQYRFDEKWNRKLLDKLEIYYFEDEDFYGEEGSAALKEHYPDTYGARGSGCYYFRSRRKTAEEIAKSEEDTYWVKEEITRQEFVKVYKEMTGLDFFTVNTDFPQ